MVFMKTNSANNTLGVPCCKCWRTELQFYCDNILCRHMWCPTVAHTYTPNNGHLLKWTWLAGILLLWILRGDYCLDGSWMLLQTPSSGITRHSFVH